MGGSYTLARLRSHIGYYLGLTGLTFKGEDVFITGVANYFIPRENIPKAYQQIKEALPYSQDSHSTISVILKEYHCAPKKEKIEHE